MPLCVDFKTVCKTINHFLPQMFSATENGTKTLAGCAKDGQFSGTPRMKACLYVLQDNFAKFCTFAYRNISISIECFEDIEPHWA